MFTNHKILTLATALTLIGAAQTSFADNPSRVIGIGTAARQNPRPASPAAGSPPIYYSNQPYVQPSITPPSMNLLPSYGYSTGLYFPPTNYLPPAQTNRTGGNRVYAPQSYGVVSPGLYYSQPVIVNQYYYYQPPQYYNYSTNIAPQPRLTHGVLNN